MGLSGLINLERIEIVEETDSDFQVRYNNEVYTIAKNSESCFVSEGASSTSHCGMKQELRLEQRLVPETGFLQDDAVRPEFKEVMMFHELREQEYKNAHFADAHKRAVNDEILYVLKFFDEQKEEYFKFAEEYRRKHLKQDSQEKLGIQEAYGRWLDKCRFGMGMEDAYKSAERLLGAHERSVEELSALITEVNKRCETASNFYWVSCPDDAAFAQMIYMPAIISAVINRIPESFGKFSIEVPKRYVMFEHTFSEYRTTRPNDEIMKTFRELLRRKVDFNFDSFAGIPITLSF